MEYVDGCNLINVIKKLDINILIDAILKAETDIRLLSARKVIFDDDNHGALFWTKNGEIKIGDTDPFFISDGISSEKVESYNLFHFNSLIELLAGFTIGPLHEYLNSKKDFWTMFKESSTSFLSNRDISITVLFKKAVDIFTREFGVAPKSIDEMLLILREHNMIDSNDESYVPQVDPYCQFFDNQEIALSTGFNQSKNK